MIHQVLNMSATVIGMFVYGHMNGNFYLPEWFFVINYNDGN